jgi:universal stress protein A
MNAWLVLPALAAIALVAVVAPVALAAYRQWRRPWRLICPNAGTVAQIRVGAARAALSEVFGRRPEIDRCSLWPARRGCDDECLALSTAGWQRMRPGEAPPRETEARAHRTIVVPLDGTRAGEAALAPVAGLAACSGATVRLLRVVPAVKELRDAADRVVAFADQERERIEAEARDYLRRLAVTLPGVAVEDVVRIGDATTEVIAEAEQTGADLIAVAVPRCRGLARFFARRATRRLRRSTTIPLLIIPCAAPAAA